jgi:hypothetical protein
MYVVVNHMKLQEGVDWPALESQVDQFQSRLSHERSDFRGISLVRVSAAEAIFLVFFDTREALDDISRNIAAPWFAEHVRAYLIEPVDRRVGEIVAGYMKQAARD